MQNKTEGLVGGLRPKLGNNNSDFVSGFLIEKTLYLRPLRYVAFVCSDSYLAGPVYLTVSRVNATLSISLNTS